MPRRVIARSQNPDAAVPTDDVAALVPESPPPAHMDPDAAAPTDDVAAPLPVSPPPALRANLALSRAGGLASRRLERAAERRGVRIAAAAAPVEPLTIGPARALVRIVVGDESEARVQISLVDRLLHVDAKQPAAPPVLPPPPAHVVAPAVFEQMVDPGGLANVGIHLSREAPRRKIGTMIAANSGRPGGAIGQADGSVASLHAKHTTQEEDMVSNWLVTACRGANARVGIGVHPYASSVYQASLHGRWGMLTPDGSDTATVQSVDYSQATDGALYGDAWCVDDVRLSAKLPSFSSADEAVFDTRYQYATSLVFVSGPNVGATGRSAVSTVRRTFNAHAEADYALFREGVKAALRAGLLAMAQLGCDVALLAFVSAGIYGGPHRDALRSEFGTIVDEILVDPRHQPALGHYFERVVLAVLA